MVDQPKKCLLFSSLMSVERPCEKSLRTHYEPEVRIHPATARCAVPTSATRCEFVEPDGRVQIAFCHDCGKCATDWVTWVEAFSTVGDV